MTKFRNVLFTILCPVLSLLLSGCKAVVLDPKGIIAADEKHLLITAVGLMLLVVIPVIILNFIIAWRYRASNNKAKYEPEWSHSTLLEVVWWAIPCVIIAILAAITWVSSHRLDPYRPLDVSGKPVVIEVVALDWRWLFIYPEQHIASINFMQFPVNVPVRFLIAADAPMNSFQIPQLAGQIYAMPGMQTRLNLMATALGDYRGFSANYSGAGFSYMNFTARASSQADFDNWVKTIQKSPNKLSLDAYNKLAQPNKDETPVYFSSVADNLFKTIVMKYMMPMKDMNAMNEKDNKGMNHKGMQDMKNLQDAQKKDYVSQRDYQSRYNKNNVPPAHK